MVADSITAPTQAAAMVESQGVRVQLGAGLSKSPAFNPGESFAQSQARLFPALSSTDESEASSSSSSSSSTARSKAVTSTQLRAVLASSMSTMYRNEVPLYGDLLSIISSVNAGVIRSNPDLISDDEISRLNVERHGAIRVGTAEELALLARIFKVFGMHAVGYYDLWKDAGLPIHATAFRPVGATNLVKNPFRIFCSLLRMDLIKDKPTRELARELLARRQIVSDRCVELLCKAERGLGEDTTKRVDGEVKLTGLTREEALEFVDRVVDIFAWHPDTPVSLSQYQLLSRTHPLVADIVSFRGPHINHLTPRTLDIDQVQNTMILQGIDAKDVVEGPPKRQNAIYLRQTSFHALSEQVTFLGGDQGVEGGKHKARFGEIEARGQALTRKGARLYDSLMAKVAMEKKTREQERGARVDKEECVEILQSVFRDGFTDEKEAILREGLGWFMFSIRDESLAKEMWQRQGEGWEKLAEMVSRGALDAEPITYEDFLPASAAGIFQSNLPQQPAPPCPRSAAIPRQPETSNGEERTTMDEAEAKTRLEHAVGGTILDYFALYSEQQRQSLADVAARLQVELGGLVQRLEAQSA